MMNFDRDFDDWTDQDLVEMRRALRQLLDSAGWQAYASLVQKQIVARTDGLILSPLTSIDGTLMQEYAKGEISALRLAISFPETLINEITSTLQSEGDENAGNKPQ